jgi:hypothetical protein
MARADTDLLRPMYGKILSCRALHDGREPNMDWVVRRMGDFVVRRQRRAQSDGWHQMGRVTIYLHPHMDPWGVLETLLHEAVHAAMWTSEFARVDPHGSEFWARMTRAARELRWIAPETVLHEDGQLEQQLHQNHAANTVKSKEGARG